jgi:hypothetical protein
MRPLAMAGYTMAWSVSKLCDGGDVIVLLSRKTKGTGERQGVFVYGGFITLSPKCTVFPTAASTEGRGQREFGVLMSIDKAALYAQKKAFVVLCIVCEKQQGTEIMTQHETENMITRPEGKHRDSARREHMCQ